MTWEVVLLGIGGLGLLFLSSFALGCRTVHQHLQVQRELLQALEQLATQAPMRREVALRKARRLRRSRARMQRLNRIGLDAGKYFVQVNRNENEIDRRLRQFGIDLAAIDMPPEIERLDQATNDDGVLLPPNPTDGRNERVFRRNPRE